MVSREEELGFPKGFVGNLPAVILKNTERSNAALSPLFRTIEAADGDRALTIK